MDTRPVQPTGTILGERELGRFGDVDRPMVAAVSHDSMPQAVRVYVAPEDGQPVLVCVLTQLTADEPRASWDLTADIPGGEAVRQWAEYEAFRLYRQHFPAHTPRPNGKTFTS